MDQILSISAAPVLETERRGEAPRAVDTGQAFGGPAGRRTDLPLSQGAGRELPFITRQQRD